MSKIKHDLWRNLAHAFCVEAHEFLKIILDDASRDWEGAATIPDEVTQWIAELEEEKERLEEWVALFQRADELQKTTRRRVKGGCSGREI